MPQMPKKKRTVPIALAESCSPIFREELATCRARLDLLTSQQKDVEKDIENEKKEGNTYVVRPVCSQEVSKGVKLAEFGSVW